MFLLSRVLALFIPASFRFSISAKAILEIFHGFQHGFKVYHSVHLGNFIKEHYPQCEFLAEHFDDILSTTEMEICSLGVAFIG